MPSDAQRVEMFSWLKAEGKIPQLLASHDIHTRHRLVRIIVLLHFRMYRSTSYIQNHCFQVKYGGHGYSHLLTNVVPKMLLKGYTQQDVDTIFIKNPKAWLTGERV